MKTCRACLQKEADEYCSIFKKINQATLDEMFHSLTGIRVSRGDGLPDCVCQECSDFIVMCNNFRKKCLKSDVQLRALLPTEDSEGEHFQTTQDSERQSVQETDCSEENPLTEEECQLVIKDHADIYEEDLCSETEILVEQLDVEDGKSIIEQTADHESYYELYDVVEDVEFGEIEALNECEDDDSQDAIIERIESTQETNESSVDDPVESTVQATEFVIECCGCPGVQFPSADELKQHSAQVHENERILTNLRPYECDICYKRFISHAALSKHQAAPYRKKKYGCQTCGASFCSRSALHGHTNSAHTRDRKYVCDVCQKGFYTSSTMLSHRQIHGEKKYQCSTCAKKFLRQSDLLSHQMTHSDERPYGCGECEMRFKCRSHLRDHQTVHTGERTKKCRICGKGFGTYGDRRVHELRHENVHPFKCGYCSKTYGRNYKLQVHIRKEHTKERPFACSDCPERFFQRWEMLGHQRVVHGKMEGIESVELETELHDT
ncbi:AGAP004259-PA [Anopheles gambiae str. PEST]|uniref:AGAP004259-PA n=1 Tax=Anopheles gambiae TaxID=7165 RepID=Q5TTA9_ANOGA|nr:AGAP004259-PA [Anopheles gambiae str. PEST]